MVWTRQTVIEKLESLGEDATKAQMYEFLSTEAITDGIDPTKVLADLMSYQIYADAK